MRILHINTADNDGGAARSAFRLHTGLLEAGHDSRMLVGYQVEANRPEIRDLRPSSLSRRGFRRLLGEVERMTGLQYLLLPWGRQILEHPFVRDTEVIHLHNLHGGFFPIRILPELSRRVPLVWSVCDFWLMTGHCSYPSLASCERWRQGCGKCPALNDPPAISIDTTRLLWHTKRKLYARCRGTVVAKSSWGLKMVQDSPLLSGFDKICIANGYRIDVFAPLSRAVARQALGIAANVSLVFLGAHDLSGPRKGGAYLLQALEALRNEFPSLTLLAAGSDQGDISGSFKGFKLHRTGMLRSDNLLATCYNASDVTALPVLADNSPNVMYESMACGVPVVGFNVGGVPDAVRHMETGYLARPRDVRDFAEGLRLLLADAELRQRLGKNARSLVVRDFSLERQVTQFVKLYKNVCEQRRDPAFSMHSCEVKGGAPHAHSVVTH